MIYYKLCCNPMRFIRNCLFLNGSSQKYKEDSFREKKILQNQKNNFIHHNSTALLCDTTANFGSRNQYNANGKYTSTEHACGKYTCGKRPCRKQTCGKHTCGKYACSPPLLPELLFFRNRKNPSRQPEPLPRMLPMWNLIRLHPRNHFHSRLPILRR